MKTLIAHNRTATLVWAVLSLATVVTWWLGEGGINVVEIGTVAVILIAAFKIRLVVLYFMELKDAPFPLRQLIEGWIIFFSGAILIGYWLSVR